VHQAQEGGGRKLQQGIGFMALPSWFIDTTFESKREKCSFHSLFFLSILLEATALCL
jgi:hypothetical protein